MNLPQTQPFRLSLTPLIAWIASGVVILAILWGAILSELERDHELLIRQGQSEANALSDNYAQQLDYLIQHIDHLTLFMSHTTREANLGAEFQRLFDALAEDSTLHPIFIDSQGIVRSARYQRAMGADMSGQPLFTEHKRSNSLTLKIQPPAAGVGTLSGKTVIRFSRRISQRDGSFAGILSVGMVEEELMQFVAGSTLHNNDLIGIKFFNDDWLAYRLIGAGQRAALDIRHIRPDPDDTANPVVSVNGNPSVFGISNLSRYPLTMLVSITHKNLLETYGETALAYKLSLGVGTLLVLLVFALGAWRQLRRDEKKRYEERVQNTFRLAVDGAREELYMLSQFYDPVRGQVDFKIEDCNMQAARLSGLDRTELIGVPISQIMSEKNFEQSRLFLLSAMADGFAESEARFYRSGPGEKRWFHCRAVRADLGLAVTLRDIQDIKEKETQLQALAMTDALTQLPNRHWMNLHLPKMIQEASASGQKFAVLFIDLDNFKNINDTLGHQVGDTFLFDVARTLRGSIRKQDYVIRLGGDEFMVMLLDIENTEVVAEIASHLLRSLRETGEHGEWSVIRPRASIGIAIFPDDATSAEPLVQAADIAMYDAKHNGKDRFTRYTRAMHDTLSDRLSLEAALEQAVSGEQLMLYLQPRVETMTGRLAGFEALLRWQHPVLGLVSPQRFIPLAEESNLILELGSWVATSTCELLARWRNEGKPLYPISINVSAKQLRGSEFREELSRSMRQHDIQSSQIAIELTESTMVGDDVTVQQELRMLEGMGLKLMIDDFGTGYSSLAQLQKLNVDVLKIDQSLVQSLSSTGESQVLCQAMVQIGQTLGIAVVAEGVETVQQLKILQMMGCDEVQGFLISEPVPAVAAERLLSHGQFFEPAPHQQDGQWNPQQAA